MNNLDDKENQVKSEKRSKLEYFKQEIYDGWLYEQDKNEVFVDLDVFLEKILDSQTIEAFFEDNISDVAYFIGEFSIDVLKNILKQTYIIGKDGDLLAFGVLKQYLRLIDKYLHEPKYIKLLEAVKEIFDWSKQFYRGYPQHKTVDNKRYLEKVSGLDKYNVSVNINI